MDDLDLKFRQLAREFGYRSCQLSEERVTDLAKFGKECAARAYEDSVSVIGSSGGEKAAIKKLMAKAVALSPARPIMKAKEKRCYPKEKNQ